MKGEILNEDVNWSRQKHGSASLRARRNLEAQGFECSPIHVNENGVWSCVGFIQQEEQQSRNRMNEIVSEFGRLMR